MLWLAQLQPTINHGIPSSSSKEAAATKELAVAVAKDADAAAFAAVSAVEVAGAVATEVAVAVAAAVVQWITFTLITTAKILPQLAIISLIKRFLDL